MLSFCFCQSLWSRAYSIMIYVISSQICKFCTCRRKLKRNWKSARVEQNIVKLHWATSFVLPSPCRFSDDSAVSSGRLLRSGKKSANPPCSSISLQVQRRQCGGKWGPFKINNKKKYKPSSHSCLSTVQHRNSGFSIPASWPSNSRWTPQEQQQQQQRHTRFGPHLKAEGRTQHLAPGSWSSSPFCVHADAGWWSGEIRASISRQRKASLPSYPVPSITFVPSCLSSSAGEEQPCTNRYFTVLAGLLWCKKRFISKPMAGRSLLACLKSRQSLPLRSKKCGVLTSFSCHVHDWCVMGKLFEF